MNNIARSNIVLIFCGAFFFALYWLGADFGKFSIDYQEAHSISMLHLHQEGNIPELLRTIPNSASGVLPLWLYGFFDGFLTHKIISLCVFLGVIALVLNATRLNKYGRYFIMALLLSPMMISATAWILPEIFALLTVVLVCSLTVNHPKAAVIVSALVPLSRQTFIVLLAGRFFFRPKSLNVYFASALIASLSLSSLVYIWGGLVPPKLINVHITPSLKSSVVGLLTFSLYFFYQNITTLKNSPIDWSRLTISIIVAVVLIWINLLQPSLFGGGYIFSRIEARNLLLAGIFETALLTLFFYKTKINTIIFFLFASLSFGTTNYIFLKYVDFYIFAFLAFGISDIDEQSKQSYTDYARSCFMFQLFSISMAILYYYIV